MSRPKAIFFITFIVVLAFGAKIAEAKGPICLKCDHIHQPYDCKNVVRCGDHEFCSVRKYITDDGHVRFDVGCTDTQVCKAATVPFGRRGSRYFSSVFKRIASGETTLCKQCCESDICNAGTLCGANTFEHSGHSICFECQSEKGPDTCNTITMCSQDEECFLQSDIVGLSGTVAWISGCRRKDACQRFTQSQESNCHTCCSSDICNTRCPVTNTAQNTSTTVSSTIKYTTVPTTKYTDSPTTKYTVVPTTKYTDSPTTKYTAVPTTQYTDSPTTKHISISTSTHTPMLTSKYTATIHTSKYTVIPTPDCNDVTYINCTDPHVCSNPDLERLCPLTCGLCMKPQITTTSPSCRDKDPNTCLQFGADLCTRFVDYAKTNCPARCGLCDVCWYNNMKYTQGQKWYDGCKYSCECTNARTHLYQCRGRCIIWRLPRVCTLNPPEPGYCCPTPNCPSSVIIQYPPGYTKQ